MRALKLIAIVLLAGVALFAGIGLLLPRKVSVQRSVVIEAPPATVFALVNGYRMFNRWSPWHEQEPTARYTYEGPDFGPGARLTWAGNIVGSGSQEILESRAPELVRVRLDFGPDGAAEAEFRLTPEGSGTRAVWAFQTNLGNNPVSRYFGLLLDRFVGGDYQRGLDNLKKLAEEMPKADFAALEVSKAESPAVLVAYVPSSSSKVSAEIAAAIGAAYGQIGQFLAAHQLKMAGAPLTINTRWDDTGYGFDAAIPVDREPETPVPAESPVQIKKTYSGTVLQTAHKGPYETMAETYDKLNAWAAVHGFEHNGFPWDEYVSDPGNTPQPELITRIYLPVK